MLIHRLFDHRVLKYFENLIVIYCVKYCSSISNMASTHSDFFLYSSVWRTAEHTV